MKTYKMNNVTWTNAITTFVVLLGITLFTSCTEAENPYLEGQLEQGRMGTMSIGELTPEGEFSAIEYTRTEGEVLPDVNAFGVVILDKEGKDTVENLLTGMRYEWDRFDEISGQLQTIPSGKYKLAAANLPIEPMAAWDAPYYYGTQEFTIRIADLTNVTLVCKLSNIKVTVDYDQEFLNKVKDGSVTVLYEYKDPETLEELTADLTYNVGEERAGYFKVPVDGKLRVTVKGTRKEDGAMLGNGNGQVGFIENVKAMSWYRINVKYEETSKMTASITVNGTFIETEIDVLIPDGDGVIDGGPNNDNWEDEGGEPSEPSEPTEELNIVGANFNGSPFDIAEQLNVSMTNDNLIDVRFDVPKGIDKLFITINSDALIGFLPGLGLENGTPFDIANLPSAPPDGIEAGIWWVNMFADPSIGILNPDEPIKGKTVHTFSVGGLMNLLGTLPDATGSVHTFSIKVVDKSGAIKEAALAINLTE